MPSGFVYFIANKPNGILYTGVTSNLHRRACEHRESAVEAFSQRYRLKSLVYYDQFNDIRNAIQLGKFVPSTR